MSIIELLQHVGAENIEVQPLNECITNAQRSKRGGHSLITFPTHQVTPTEVATGEFNKVGLVVWIPKEKVPKI